MSNLPLFLLAAPVLTILIKSGIDVAKQTTALVPTSKSATASASKGKDKTSAKPADQDSKAKVLVASLAVSQVTLSVLALASYHVQIITRLSSGYPVWYWWVAAGLRGEDPARKKWADRIIVFGVMYALVQAALFACFLPPA